MRCFSIPIAMAVLMVAACSDRPSLPTTPLEVQPSLIAAGYDCATAQTQIDASECEALVALYAATNGPNWTNETAADRPWLVGSPCDWYGVVCAGNIVTHLDLNENNLNGSIPAQIGNLGNVRYLGLASNHLSGPIPPEFGNLSSLGWTHLFDNQLSGEIPPELGKLSNLWDIELIWNQLSGEIPPDLGNLGNLTQLNLAYNQLSGEIPPELGGLSKLRVLGLQSNQLSGAIPATFGDLGELQQLQLYQNQLSGPIPSALGNLTNLAHLGLGENQLSGPIPAWLGDLTGLEVLELQMNQLTGPIPATLGNLTLLWDLWLTDNDLRGPVPIELARLGGAEPLSGHCAFVPGNDLLYMPETEPYLDADLDSDGRICWMPFTDILPVAIDIRPGGDPNSVNCHASNEMITVAILTSGLFDATTVDHTTVTFEGATEMHVNRRTGEPLRHEEDADGDGDIDLVLHFRLGDTSLTCQATWGTLIGETFDGQSIQGGDGIRMIG